MNPRRTALDLLARWEAGDAYINLTVGHAFETLPDTDRRFLTALLYGTVEHLITLDYAIGALAARSDIRPATRDLLRLALYEITRLSTPRHAAVNEWVKLAHDPGEAGFVNAILRTALREPERMQPPPREKNLMRHLSIVYSVPVPTLRRLSPVLGDGLEDCLKALSRETPLTLSVNTLRISREDFMNTLREAGFTPTPTRYAPTGVRIPTRPVREIPGFAEGHFFVQDEASMIAVAALGALPGEKVLDLCACPGGKTFGTAIRMGDTGSVLSCDLHASKLSLIRDGAARLGISSVTARERDGTVFCEEERCIYDRVLCDVPCSGLGVLGKKPDLRYRDVSRADELPPLQRALLDCAADYVRPGGTVLYSTCTLNPAENGDVVDAFLSSHPDFTCTDFSVGDLHSDGGRITLLPHIHGTDGFFIAKLERRVP